ncbi:MAG: pyridoxamine 5'-phosphate oxidase family protein [Candidatus Dormibacteria bacterium]
MPEADPKVRELLASVDRFLQWDLVTVTPWGVPSIAPVGARLVAAEATLWTSTTVGYATKVRNIEAQPRVALLRAHPGAPQLLLRGEARVVAGDGTSNLAQLFRLMGGAGGSRAFFATSATDPFWSLLYRSYWHRFLIAVRIVDISIMGGQGWEPHRVGRWTVPRSRMRSTPRPRPRSQVGQGLLDGKGRAMLGAGTPAALATVRREGACPSIWPVRANPLAGGAILVDAGVPLPSGRLVKSSLAVRVLDDTFESAQMSGWVGTLESGAAARRFLPRSGYGFTKPPGLIGDLAAGLAATLRDLALPGPDPVSPPDLAMAVRQGGASRASALHLEDEVWRLLEQFFARRNAAAVWYSGVASLVSDRSQRSRLLLLSERAQMERDWAHALLIRGSRKVGAAQLGAGAVALRPNPLAPGTAVEREEAEVDRIRTRIIHRLPVGLAGPQPPAPERSPDWPVPRTRKGRVGGLIDVSLKAASAAAAAADRWKWRSER